MLPFSVEQFLQVFRDYNAAIWPAQILAYMLGFAVIALLLSKRSWAGRITNITLGTMWLWTGIVYHGLFFSEINKPAYLFGAVFVVQGLLFLFEGLLRDRVVHATRNDLSGWLGWGFIFYATLVYPVFGLALGHRLIETPMFGVTPCPLTVFTFGILLLGLGYSRWVLVIPVIWSLIGGSAAFLLGVPQDWLLLFSGIATCAALMVRRSAGPAQTA